MARLVFLRRAQYDVTANPGDVMFDINGKNVGKLALTDCFVDLPAGVYNIRMYKFQYNSMMGFAEQQVTVNEGETLMLQYVMPTTMAAPGHILVSDYSKQRADEITYNINAQLQQKQQTVQKVQQQSRRSHKKAVAGIIVGAVSFAVLNIIFWSLYYSLWF